MKGRIMTIMGLLAIRTHEVTEDGISYEVFSVLNSEEGIVRVYDIDSNSLLDLTKYPTYIKALGVFNHVTESLEPSDDRNDNDTFDSYEAAQLAKLDEQRGK